MHHNCWYGYDHDYDYRIIRHQIYFIYYYDRYHLVAS